MPNSSPEPYTAFLFNKTEIAKNTFEITLDFKNTEFSFSAGQYIWLVIPELKYKDEKGNRRAFSIASSPNDKSLIKIIFRGSGSGYKKTLLELPQNSEVLVYGPHGFFALPGGDEPVVFVAGGVGVAPFVSMISFAVGNKLGKNITLFFSNPNSETAFYNEFFSDLAGQDTGFKFIDNLGRLDISLIEKNAADFKKSIYYILGPADFVHDLSSQLADRGVSRDNFRFEEFYGLNFVSKNKNIDALGPDRFSLKEFQTAVVSVADHIVITDPDGYIRYANPAAEKITGYSLAEMRGNTPRLWGGLMDKTFYENLWRTIKYEKRVFEGELINMRKNGEVYNAVARISPVVENGELTGFIGTEQDVTKFKEMDRMKDEFISSASHELRTPLTAIDGIVAMVRSGEYGPVAPGVRKALDDVNTASERMIRLVNDILSLSRIQAGRLQYNLVKLNLSDLIDEIVGLFQSTARKKGITLKIYENPQVSVYADADKLKQVLTNLLNNAFKFTESGEINVSCVLDNDFVKVYVTDTGIGIKEEDKKLLFEKFQQLGNLNSNQGTGLGLYLSKEMITKMGGSMWLEKSRENEGCVFAFCLPVSGKSV